MDPITQEDSANSTLNFTNKTYEKSLHESNHWPWSKIFLINLFCLLIITIIIGNTLVILSVITTRRLRTVTNLFVTSLAVADWFVGLLVMPPAVYKFSMGSSWPLGWILCQFWISLDVLLCTASILSLCAISIDRYLAVTQPLSYSKRRRSKRLAMGMILIVWLMALIITCPQLFWSDTKSREENVECEYNKDKGYVIYSAFGSFFIPMSIMLYVYMRIFCVLSSRQSRISRTEAFERADNENEFATSEIDACYQTSKEIGINSLLQEPSQQATTLYELLEFAKTRSILKTSNNLHQSTSHSNLSSSSGSNRNSLVTKSTNLVQFNPCQVVGGESNPSIKSKMIPIRISSLKRETKTAQTLSIVVVSFIACWLPFFVHYIARPFIDNDSIWTNEILEQVLLWLGWVNSSINPFIYAFYNNDFRIAFYRLTFRSCHRSQQNNIFMK